MAEQRAAALAGQFVMDTHTHFLRDDTRLTGFVKQREAVGKAGWNKSLSDKEQTLDDLNTTTTSRKSISTATPRWRC